MKLWKKYLLPLAAILLMSGCVTTAGINQEAAVNYAEVKQKAKAEGVLDTASPTAKQVHSVFHRMKPYAEKSNQTGVPFQWEITVLKSNELNAWAMPGGKMAFYTGLVEKLNLNDDEVAVVMGHEMAHALQEHGKSARTVGIASAVVGTVADVAASVALGASTEGFFGMTTDLIANKPFSRSQETEADEIGIMLMADAGYNPEYAPKLWAKMSQAAGGSKGLAIFSTHPSDSSRQENLRRLVPEAMKRYQAAKK